MKKQQMRCKNNDILRKSVSKQLLLADEFRTKKEFGGSLLKKSHPKCSRPISTKQAMHITLKSSKAVGKMSFLSNRTRSLTIENVIYSNAKKFRIKIYRYANVGNHIHLLVLASHRVHFQSFIRSISGIIARITLGAQRGFAKLNEKTKFWDQRPWSRIIEWMKDFKIAANYVEKNFKIAQGFLKSNFVMYTSTA